MLSVAYDAIVRTPDLLTARDYVMEHTGLEAILASFLVADALDQIDDDLTDALLELQENSIVASYLSD